MFDAILQVYVGSHPLVSFPNTLRQQIQWHTDAAYKPQPTLWKPLSHYPSTARPVSRSTNIAGAALQLTVIPKKDRKGFKVLQSKSLLCYVLVLLRLIVCQYQGYRPRTSRPYHGIRSFSSSTHQHLP